VLAAESQLGMPYVWGGGDASGPTTGLAGTPPAGFDCSGLVLYSLAQVVIVVPHYSGLGGQWSLVEAYGHYSTDPSALVPGDLVFFVGSDGTRSNPGHVGIVVGHDEMIDAPPKPARTYPTRASGRARTSPPSSSVAARPGEPQAARLLKEGGRRRAACGAPLQQCPSQSYHISTPHHSPLHR